jgi:hypothetical protein
VWFQTGLYGFLEATFFPYWLQLRLHSQQAKRYPTNSAAAATKISNDQNWVELFINM